MKLKIGKHIRRLREGKKVRDWRIFLRKRQRERVSVMDGDRNRKESGKREKEQRV